MPLTTTHQSHSVKCLVQRPRLVLKGNASAVGKAAGSWCEAVLSLNLEGRKARGNQQMDEKAVQLHGAGLRL